MAAGDPRGRGRNFEGLLFEGKTTDKSWTLVFQKHVTMTIRPPGGVAKGGTWSLIATQKDEPVWEGSVESELKHRVRDNFVQWQHKSPDRATTTFGLRLKTAEVAQQFNSVLGEAVASTGVRTTKRSATEIVELLIVPPHGEPLPLTLHPTTTISQVMAIVAERHKLDPAHYNLALPAEDPKGEGVACFGSMTVSRLKTHRLYLRRQPGAPEEAWLNSGDKGIIQMELPRGEKTSVKASGDTTLPELLLMVCRKRNLEVEDLKFDLPATEDSLAGKTLGQLKMTFFKIIPRADTTVDKHIKLHDDQTPSDSPKVGNRRHAPAPPSVPAKPRKVMKELSTEETERLKREEEEEEATPTNSGPLKGQDKPLPPPVALKPKKKTDVAGGGREEVDGSRESPSIPRSTLDSLVMGVKVRKAAECPEMMGTITEGLKMSAASGGRYLSVKRRRQQSMEEPAKSTQPAPRSHRRSREMEDIDVRHLQPSPLATRNAHSLRRRPRGPAPVPPGGVREHRATTLNRQALLTAREKKEGDTGTGARKPVRKAPVRPAPTKPESKTTPTDKTVEETTPPRDHQQTDRENSATPPPPKVVEETKKEVMEEEKRKCEEEEEDVDFTGYEFHTLTPPRVQSPPTTPSDSSPNTVVTATVVPQEGGGKTLIIKPSPGSSRRANIIFNLPPPPPPPEFCEEEACTHGNGVDTSSSDTPDTSIAMATGNQSTNELSVVSNEYTNLDEESEDEESVQQLASLTEVSQTEECGEGQEGEGSGEKEEEGGEEERDDGESENNVETKSQENGVAVGEDEDGKTVVLTLNEDISALNCNGNNNNNNHCYPLPPLEFVAPAERFSTPAPQEGFTMPAEPSFDDDSEEMTDSEDDPVVLVTMTTHREAPIVVEEREGERKMMKGWDSTISVGTQLSLIDSFVESMQDTTEEMITEIEIPPPPPPSPPIPIVAPSPPPPPPITPSVKKSPLPPRPAPPPTVPSLRKPPAMSSRPPAVSSPVTHVTSVQQPTVSAPPSHSHRVAESSDSAEPTAPHSTRAVGPVHVPQTTVSSRTPGNSAPPHSPRVSRATNTVAPPVSHPVSDAQPPNTWQPRPTNPVSGPQTVPQSGNVSAGDMGLQLQLLQQQVLQQQMIQLQQQFQQLQQSIQHSATPAATMTMMPPAMYPHPALVAMTMGGMPGMGQSVAMPTSGMVPMNAMMGQFSPVTCSPPHPLPITSTPTSQEKPHRQNDVIPEEKPRPQGDGTSRPDSEGPSDVTAQLRAGALGPMEPEFDKLMEDVKEVEQSALLRKVPVDLADKEGDGSYSGMAAVLAEALRERRKHLTTTDRLNQTSVSLDLDDSRLSEWDS